MGQHAESRDQAIVARSTYSRLVELHPDWENYRLRLATAFAILDQREVALREARRVLHRGMVISNNNNRRLEIGVMRVYLLIGDYDTAINEIERLISLPSALTKASLRLDPIYDPLRDNPRFQALLVHAR